MCVGTRQQILTANDGVGPSPGYLLPAHRAATLWCGRHPSPNPWWQPRDQSRRYKHVNGGQIFVTEVTKFLLLHIIFVSFRKRFFENLAVIIYPSSLTRIAPCPLLETCFQVICLYLCPYTLLWYLLMSFLWFIAGMEHEKWLFVLKITLGSLLFDCIDCHCHNDQAVCNHSIINFPSWFLYQIDYWSDRPVVGVPRLQILQVAQGHDCSIMVGEQLLSEGLPTYPACFPRNDNACLVKIRLLINGLAHSMLCTLIIHMWFMN